MYRICQPEDEQIKLLAQFLNQRGGISSVWTDGSNYGKRLEKSLLSFVPINSSSKYIALFGSHVNIAAKLLQDNNKDVEYVLPDDCAIDEFDHILAGTKVKTITAHPFPNYHDLFKSVILSLNKTYLNKGSFLSILNNRKYFIDRQYLFSKFKIILKAY